MIKSNRKARIIFIPVYKSYADPFILHYVHYLHDLDLCFSFGNYEDSAKMRYVDPILKSMGLLLIRRDPKNSLSMETVHNILNSSIKNYVN